MPSSNRPSRRDAIPRPGRDERRSREDSAAANPALGDQQQQVVFGIFVAMLIAVTVLQKIGYALTASFAVPVALPVAYIALFVGVLFARPVFRPERLLLYLAVVTLCTLSNVLFARLYSVQSMIFCYLLYLPLLVAFEVKQETYRRCLLFLSNLMLVFAAVVWIQHGIQLSIGWRYWPDLDKLVPQQWLIPEYNYLQPIEWDNRLMKPSGICFLEVAVLSQFLVLALVVELLFLQRTWRAVFFGATLVATFAGTGLVLLALSLPIVFSRANMRVFGIILITAFAALFVALQLHWFDVVAHRFGEFQQVGSSGNSRFVAPLDRVRMALADARTIFGGVGAGQIERGSNIYWWPAVKVVVEYGLVEGIAFYAFYLFSMVDHTPSRQLAFVLALWFSFEGTLLIGLYPVTCVILSTMFFIPESRRGRRRTIRSTGDAAVMPFGKPA